MKREPTPGQGNYGGTPGGTVQDEWVYGWAGGGGGGIGGGSGGTGDGNSSSTDKSGTAYTGSGGGGGGESGAGKRATGKDNSGNAGDGGHGYAILYLTKTSSFKVDILDSYRSSSPTASGFQNQAPYNTQIVQRKIYQQKLNTLEFISELYLSGKDLCPL